MACLLSVIVIAAFLVVGRHQDRAVARPPARPSSTPLARSFGIETLRTVSAASGDPFSAPIQTSFPDPTSSIVVDVTYHGANPATPLGISVSRTAASGQPVAAVLDTSYILTPAPDGRGQNAIVIATPLSLGHYLLTATYAGQAVFTSTFDVVPAPRTPSR